MASGTITGSTSDQYIDAKIEWSSKTYPLNNSSSVTAALYLKSNTTGYTTEGTGKFYLYINGVGGSVTKSVFITENAWVKVYERSAMVEHNSDGTKSVLITTAGTGSISGTTLTSINVRGTVALDTIPRISTLDSVSCDTKYFNGTITYKYTPKSENFYNRCNISLNLDGEYIAIKSINLGQKTASQQTATVILDESELSTIYNKFPSSTSGKLRFTFLTYWDAGYSSQVGDAPYEDITLNIPDIDATKPTATMTLTPVSSLSSPFDTLYIKGRSKIDADFTNVQGKYGASIVSCTMSVLGKNYGAPYTSEYITTEGDISVTGTIKDSRGFSRVYTQTITVIPYANPRILPASGNGEIVCARCDASGNLSDSGTYLRIKAKRSYSKVLSGGVQNNFCLIRYRYKTEGGSYSSWTTILANDSTGDEVDTGALLGGALLPTSTYVAQVGVIDTLGESDYTTISIATDKIYMHRAGSINSLGIGKYAEEENTIDIAEEITAKFRGKVNFAGETWLNLGLSTSVEESESNVGRLGGTGCYYRVCAGEKHVYVAFNCAFTYSGSAMQINLDAIPPTYRPKSDIYAICATEGRAVAGILVTKEGSILVDWIQIISSAEQTTSSTVKWIDGYLDYWI